MPLTAGSPSSIELATHYSKLDIKLIDTFFNSSAIKVALSVLDTEPKEIRGDLRDRQCKHTGGSCQVLLVCQSIRKVPGVDSSSNGYDVINYNPVSNIIHVDLQSLEPCSR